MTRKSRTSIIAIAAGLTVSGFTLVAYSSSANASNVLSCDGAGRQPLIQCCETAVLEHGRPLWMRQSGKNCLSATIKCSGRSDVAGAVNKRCWYVAEYDHDSKRMHEPKSRDNGHDPAGAPN
jgi:hypothetical protein